MKRNACDSLIIEKLVLFIAILCVLFIVMCNMIQPLWKEWNNYETIAGFYQEPENTIETIFLGPSTVVNGVSPMELYDTYGFCTYNLGMEQQPLLASYYWLKEAYRLHSDTLHVVFLDPSSMRQDQSIEFYQKAIDRMAISPIKFEAVAAYNKTWNSMVEHFIPLLEYHDRWDEISDLDYEKKDIKPINSTRGYNFSKSLNIDTQVRYQNLSVHHSWYDPKAIPVVFTEESLDYFEKMVSFCKEKGLLLVLVSPVRPTSWNSELHNAVIRLADDYNISYYDLNASPMLDQLDFVMGFDHQDNHLNYYGAKKITAWYGEYLSINGLNHDISDTGEYSFMEDQLDDYLELIDHEINILNYDDVGDYLQAVTAFEHCYVLVSIKDDCIPSLTQHQRDQFDSLGLKELADIGARESYIGVIKDGVVETELCDKTAQSINNPEGYLRFRTKEGIILKSGGFYRGNLSSVIINKIEFSGNQRGLNIVVYNYEKDKVYDSVTFDTYLSSKTVRNTETELQKAVKEGIPWYKMEEKVKNLYLYNRRYHNQQYKDYWNIYGDETSLFAYLNLYNKVGYVVILSVKEDASASLSDEARSAFSELGLKNLVGLQSGDSYIGILDEGIACFEQRSHGENPIRYSDIDFSITSGGIDSGNISSVLIHGNEESLNKRGLNIVVYDKQLQEAVSSITFDTYAQTPSMKQELEVKEA